MLCGDWHNCLPEDRLFFVAGVALGEACTIVLRGATQQILDEAERSLHDALCVLAQTVKETRTVYGGGRLGVQNCFVSFILLLPGKSKKFVRCADCKYICIFRCGQN